MLPFSGLIIVTSYCSVIFALLYVSISSNFLFNSVTLLRKIISIENILFLNGKANVQKILKHTIQIIRDESVNMSGFRLVTDDGSVYGAYEDYTTLYRRIKGGFILSNDGFVYQEPQLGLEVKPCKLTLGELQEKKV